MRYPTILFFRYEKYANPIDKYLEETKAKHLFHYTIVNTSSALVALFKPSNHLLITYGPNEPEYIGDVNSVICPRIRSRWLHFKFIGDIDEFNQKVNYCYLRHIINADRSVTRPGFSIFTTTFNSYHRILRCYESIRRQNYRDWEWVIVDDSTDDNHFIFLKNLFKTDPKVRLFRKSENSGIIGDVKNEASSLCRGKYVLEMDHDDEIMPDVLDNAVRIFEADPEVGFVYMDTINIYEDGRNFKWADSVSKGYGCYYSMKFRDKWMYVYITPNINNITMSHITCMPNHPRIWRRDVLYKVGGYSEFLPIVDDQELMLRTVTSTKSARVHQFGYLQYMNEGGNNFTWIRNAEIQRIGPLVTEHFNQAVINVDENLKLRGGYEDPSYKCWPYKNLWMRPDDYVHKYANSVYNFRYDAEYCILGLDSLYQNIDRIRELYTNPRNDILLLDNRVCIEGLWYKLDSLGLDRVKCYVHPEFLGAEKKRMELYFMRMYKSCEKWEIIDSMHSPEMLFNTELDSRPAVINKRVNDESRYLEIGVEYGGCFNNICCTKKTGVDPDPKFSDPRVVCKTSDGFFADLAPEVVYDIIFIDGMHQSEYLLRDLNNSLKHLSPGGAIFIDDILPANIHEQYKFPSKHYYENGVLKYGEPEWTGDVWKVVYHLMKKYKDRVASFQLYNHGNYRGVGMFTFTSNDFEMGDISEIEAYDYVRDFDDYLRLLG